ncbi:hypothetical protein HGB07_01010 [Candidatus Roizmanbacteria bacterium]|nr:hypothetical protein [Candidatus Roizmanbacteria bacterium]
MMMKQNIKLITVFVILLIASVVVWNYQKASKIQSIDTFEECAQAGYPIMESYPEQCRAPDGRNFTKQISASSDLRPETIDEIGLSFQHPKDFVFRKEITDSAGSIRTAGFFLTKGSENNPEYQMYGLYEQYKDATEQDLERAKTEMDPASIKEATIDGYKGIEGLIVGPKTRYVTIVLKGKALFSISTLPPTPANKSITDQILPTLNFK